MVVKNIYYFFIVIIIMFIINACGRRGDLDRPLDQPEFSDPAVIDDRRVYRY